MTEIRTDPPLHQHLRTRGSRRTSASRPSLRDSHALVTGANSGIGKADATDYVTGANLFVDGSVTLFPVARWVAERPWLFATDLGRHRSRGEYSLPA